MEPETEYILDNIRKKRLEKGISVLNLSLDAEIAHSHLFYIESKRIVPSVDVLVRIAKALNIKVSELVDNKAKK
ncbi:MAG: helix-turn-helix domain-containing protein [Treponema sp.]|nr:helix-turn-helix domain-containing protein [Treponema sp.]